LGDILVRLCYWYLEHNVLSMLPICFALSAQIIVLTLQAFIAQAKYWIHIAAITSDTRVLNAQFSACIAVLIIYQHGFLMLMKDKKKKSANLVTILIG
jgi:hypothetical protein